MPLSLALSRPIPEMHMFIHSVSHSANSCQSNIFLEQVLLVGYHWVGPGCGPCHWKGRAPAGSGWGHTLGVTCMVHVGLGTVMKICIQVLERQGHPPAVDTPLTILPNQPPLLAAPRGLQGSLPGFLCKMAPTAPSEPGHPVLALLPF